MKKLMILICLFISSNLAAQYDQYEEDMIANASEYRVNDLEAKTYHYESERVSFTYKESNDEVEGDLVVNGVVCKIYGLYTGEGTYFGSVWINEKNRGVIYWNFSDGCTTIINKIQDKTFESEVCKVNV